jgi:hypothetical protein
VLARLVAVAGGLVAGVALLLLAELVLRLCGVGADLPRVDPFAGFSTRLPTFVPAQRADGTPVYRLAAGRLTIDEPQREVLATKPAGTFRIFVVGKPSAAGRPYGSGYAFPAWLYAAVPALRVNEHVARLFF